VNTLVQDLNLLSLIKLSPIFDNDVSGLFRDLFILLQHYINFPINDQTGAQYTREESYDRHCTRLARLQRVSLKHAKSKLTILALSNYGAIEQRQELENHLSQLTDSELLDLCVALNFRTSYPPSTAITVGKDLLLEILISAHERLKSFQEIVKDLSVTPTEVNSHYEYSLTTTGANQFRLNCTILLYSGTILTMVPDH
jgi:intron-binding protein aquarius